MWPCLRSRRARRLTGLVIGALVALFLMLQVVRDIQIEDVRWHDWIGELGWYAAGTVAGVLAVATAIMLWVWADIMRTIHPVAPKITMRQHGIIYLATALGKRLPGAFWHVASRALLYERLGTRKRVVLATTGMEVLLMTGSGGLLMLFLLPTILSYLSSHRPIALLLIVLCIASVLSLHPRVSGRLSMSDVPLPPIRIGLWVAALMIVWLLGGWLLTFLVQRLYSIPWSLLPQLTAVWVATALIGTLTLILPAGFGIADLSLIYFLSFAIPTAEAAFVALVLRLSALAWDLLMAAISGVITLLTERNHPNG
ncbi:MAG: hypothetical protein KDD73_01550 [Anaerolineales bacterium]|nr:hypothetical protein [Anaerolineales bacterium]